MNGEKRCYLLEHAEHAEFDVLFLFLFLFLFLWKQAELEVQLIAVQYVLEGDCIAAFQCSSDSISEKDNLYLHCEQVDQKGHLHFQE